MHCLNHRHPGFDKIALINRSTVKLPNELKACPFFDDCTASLNDLNPELVSINTYSNTHTDYTCLLDYQNLCTHEQAFMFQAIREDINLENHMQNAIQSLRICLAADESIRNGSEISL